MTVGHLGAVAAGGLVFKSTPNSGPPGTVISADSIDLCPAAPPPNYVKLFLADQGGHVVASQPFPDHPFAPWSASITVPANLSAGPYSLTAACFSSGQRYAVYQPNGFTVTQPPTPPPTPLPTPPPNGGSPTTKTPVPTNVTPEQGPPNFALVILVEPAKALGSVADLSAALARSAGGDLAPSPGGWTAALGSHAIGSWPERVAVADGVYLDLLRITLDGQPVGASPALPRTGEHFFEVVVTPAYRVSLRSSYGNVFGAGVYRYGTLARVGIENERVGMDGAPGLLGGHEQFSGWDGLDTDQRIATVAITRPLSLEARWRDDVVLPAVLFGVLALWLLLVTTPGGVQGPTRELVQADTTVAIRKKGGS